MKQTGLVLISSLLSAILAIFFYRLFETPREVIIKEPSPVKYVRYDGKDSNLATSAIPLTAPKDFISTSELVTSAVVNIRAEAGGTFDFWSNSDYGASTGSGVIISSNGYIVTNNHVVENGEKIQITLHDRREYEARKIGTDPSTDLALLKIEEKDLPYLMFGNSDSVRVGEWVLAVGNPFDLESTVTAGIVSAKGRNIEILKNDLYSIESFIQTDAMVNPGNSGGALVNIRGELVGINTAIMTRSGHYEGYSFAVPSNLTSKVIQDLELYGEVQRGVLGISIEEVDNKLAKRLGLPNVEGVYIKSLTKDGGAAQSGIRKGDVIVSVNGVVTRTVPELQEQVGRFRPGDAIDVEYMRKGKKERAKVTLKNRNLTPELADYRPNRNILKDVGFELRALLSNERKRLGIENGVKVLSIYKGSIIEERNMDIGFIILKVNDVAVSNAEEVIVEIERSEGEIELKGIYEDYTGEYVYTFDVKN
ncbi:MAG: trypsin-like peptidase domain-containing protein [Bacteroidota bacterium]